MNSAATVQRFDGWWVYLIGCQDGSIYVGISRDVARRIAEHRSGGAKAARYLRGRAPLRLLAAEPVGERGDALAVEYRLKRCSAQDKAAMTRRPARLTDFIDEVVAARAEP